jgi:hypothetical protein
MILDFVVSYIGEKVLKFFFADNKPKPMVKDGMARREARRAEEKRLEDEKEMNELEEKFKQTNGKVGNVEVKKNGGETMVRKRK